MRLKRLESNRKGFTLTELMVGLIVGAVLILALGAITQIAFESHGSLKEEAFVYEDLNYVLGRVEFLLRESSGATVVTSTDPPWTDPPYISDVLIIDDGANSSAFCLHQAAAGQNIDFVYIPDTTLISNREVLFSSAGPLNLAFNLDGRGIQLIFSGTKNAEDFNIEKKVTRRN